MNITVIGTGYVGLVTGACLSEMGNLVHCFDVNPDKIHQLKHGIMPIYEPGLDTMVKENMADGRLRFINSLKEQTTQPNIYFIAVGTPSDSDGSADLTYVLNAARGIGKHINDYCIVVDKSTVPVGTADLVKKTIQEELDKRNVKIEFDLVSNPEFLKEGAAINDFMKPDRIIVGVDNETAKNMMKVLYAPFTRNHECVLFMSIRDAEMVKYASNAMLATKISFMNEISNICERVGADVENVRLGLGSDKRIGYSYIYAGCGYGGSCFPKDVKALIKIAEDEKFDPLILKAVENRNYSQKQVLAKKLISQLGEDLSQKMIAVWGLSFKPGTDDIRDAPSIEFIREVISRGGKVKAFDPVAMDNVRKTLPAEWLENSQMFLTEKQDDVFEGADAFVLITEWNHFRSPDFLTIKRKMRGNLVIDGRNQYSPHYLKSLGFTYLGIGR